MSEKNQPLNFILSFKGEHYDISVNREEYTDLRILIKDKMKLDFFGGCGGVGRCATCVVEISFSSQKNSKSYKEFSCQVAVNDRLTNKVISIIGDTLSWQ